MTSTMKAAVVTDPTATPIYTDFPVPTPDADHRLIDLVAAGLHPVVRSRISGGHYSSAGTWPAVPGLDAVARTDDGHLIYTGMVDAPWGTFAEQLCVPTRFGFPLPDDADPLAVAAGANPGMASYLPLRSRRSELDDAGLGTVLILGATGIAGRIAVDNAFALGATHVVAVGRNRDVLAALGSHGGALTTVPLTGDDDAAAIRTALHGAAPTTVLDFVWGTVAEIAFVALTDPALVSTDAGIVHIEIGTMAGADAAVPGALLRGRSYRISGSGLGSVSLADMATALPEFLDVIASGTVHIPYTTYPLAQVDAAWNADAQTRAVVVPG